MINVKITASKVLNNVTKIKIKFLSVKKMRKKMCKNMCKKMCKKMFKAILKITVWMSKKMTKIML